MNGHCPTTMWIRNNGEPIPDSSKCWWAVHLRTFNSGASLDTRVQELPQPVGTCPSVKLQPEQGPDSLQHAGLHRSRVYAVLFQGLLLVYLVSLHVQRGKEGVPSQGTTRGADHLGGEVGLEPSEQVRV